MPAKRLVFLVRLIPLTLWMGSIGDKRAANQNASDAGRPVQTTADIPGCILGYFFVRLDADPFRVQICGRFGWSRGFETFLWSLINTGLRKYRNPAAHCGTSGEATAL